MLGKAACYAQEQEGGNVDIKYYCKENNAPLPIAGYTSVSPKSFKKPKDFEDKVIESINKCNGHLNNPAMKAGYMYINRNCDNLTSTFTLNQDMEDVQKVTNNFDPKENFMDNNPYEYFGDTPNINLNALKIFSANCIDSDGNFKCGGTGKSGDFKCSQTDKKTICGKIDDINGQIDDINGQINGIKQVTDQFSTQSESFIDYFGNGDISIPDLKKLVDTCVDDSGNIKCKPTDSSDSNNILPLINLILILLVITFIVLKAMKYI